MNSFKFSVLLVLTAICGIVAGRTFRIFTAPSSSLNTVPAKQNSKAKLSSTPLKYTEKKASNAKMLTVAQMNQESEKEWHADYSYMRNMWFGGSHEKINKVSEIIRKDFCEMPQRLESVEAKHLFINAQTDDEKRHQFHLWTRARLYEMIRVLEVAKKHQLLTRANPTSLQPATVNRDRLLQDLKPPQPAVERAPNKTYQ